MLTTRLATLALLAASACATQPGDELDLSGLSSYDADTGGGKADDPNCSDVTYREFIQGYLRGDLMADANPCVQGNDASYRIWAYAAGETLKPTLEAYGKAIQDRTDGTATRDDVIAAGTLDDATKAALEKLTAIRPAHAGLVGFDAWRQFLYAPAFQAALRGVGKRLASLPEDIDQLPYAIAPFEDEWLGYIERNQPTATEGKTWAVWWESIKDTFGTNWRWTDAEETALTARLAATRPVGNFDEDATYFQTQIVGDAVTTVSLAGFAPTGFDSKVTLRPRGGGVESYKAWTNNVQSLLNSLYLRTNPELQTTLQNILDTKPCASGAEVDAIAQEWSSNRDLWGNAPDGTPIADLAAPVACDVADPQ